LAQLVAGFRYSNNHRLRRQSTLAADRAGRFLLLVIPSKDADILRQAVQAEPFKPLAVATLATRWGLVLSLFWGFCCPAAPLKWEQRQGYRVAGLAVPTAGHSGFTLLSPAETGVYLRISLLRTLRAESNLLNGAVSPPVISMENGQCDLFFCNLEGSCGLFRNLGIGNSQMSRRERRWLHQSGLAAAVFADINATVGWTC